MLSTQTQQTMLTTEIVKIINDMRDEGTAELRHDHFMAKVVKVLGEEAAPKFRVTYKDSQNKERPCYALPKRETNLMVMSESYKVQAAVYDKMTELEKPLSQLEILVQSAQVLVDHEKKLAATQQQVEAISERVENISVDLRNGVPHNFISKSNAHRQYGKGLSRAIFDAVMAEYEVTTQKYVHSENGHSALTFAYKEAEIEAVVNDFIDDATQKTTAMCYSKVLNRRFGFIKP